MADAGAAAGGGSKLPESPFFKETGHKRGIPEAIFIEDVEKLCEGQDPTIQVAKLQELYNKYMYMQSSILAQRSALKTKLPDITQALDVVNHVVEKRDKASGEGDETEYTYQLAENIWAKAKAPPTSCVCLWLGANCMLEYSVDEALELLNTNKTNAQTTLKSLEEDYNFLRDQITTTEVNIARCHNLGVKQRQLKKELEAAKGEKGQAVEGQAAVGGIGGKFAPAAREGAPKGNYTWKQESEEVEVSVPMPKGASKNDVKVTILAESIKVECDGKAILEGQLAGKCSTSGSTWTMAGSRVEITLVKAESAMWPALFEA